MVGSKSGYNTPSSFPGVQITLISDLKGLACLRGTAESLPGLVCERSRTGIRGFDCSMKVRRDSGLFRLPFNPKPLHQAQGFERGSGSHSPQSTSKPEVRLGMLDSSDV